MRSVPNVPDMLSIQKVDSYENQSSASEQEVVIKVPKVAPDTDYFKQIREEIAE